MEAHLNNPLNLKKKKKGKKIARKKTRSLCLEIGFCMETFCLRGFKFHLFPLLIEICDWNSTPLGLWDSGIRRRQAHLTGKPGVGDFLIWSLAWREVYCSTGCCSPRQVNC